MIVTGCGEKKCEKEGSEAMESKCGAGWDGQEEVMLSFFLDK